MAQSLDAWNIPEQNGKNWREGIKDEKENGIDITWKTSTAKLPEKEGDHNEYLTKIVNKQHDDILNRDIDINQLKKSKFYFDAGEKEKEYNANDGSANLVKATEVFIKALQKKGITVIDDEVHILSGGHHNMTWMRDNADALRAIHPKQQLTQKLTKTEEKNSPDQQQVSFSKLQATYSHNENIKEKEATIKSISDNEQLTNTTSSQHVKSNKTTDSDNQLPSNTTNKPGF